MWWDCREDLFFLILFSSQRMGGSEYVSVSRMLVVVNLLTKRARRCVFGLDTHPIRRTAVVSGNEDQCSELIANGLTSYKPSCCCV